MKKTIKLALFGFLGIFLYFLLYNIEGLPFYLLGIDTKTISPTFLYIYLAIYEIMMICIFALIYNKELKEQFNDMKKNHKKYFSENFKYYLIGFGIMLISNLIIIVIYNKGLSTNENTIREMLKINPIYIYFSAVLFAPFVEETIFRGCIKKIITNKYLYIIISGLVFGYVHINGNINSISDLFYIIPYGGLGCAFAYIYTKTKNIFTSMGFHLMHNGVIISLQFLLLLF